MLEYHIYRRHIFSLESIKFFDKIFRGEIFYDQWTRYNKKVEGRRKTWDASPLFNTYHKTAINAIKQKCI